MKSILRIVAAAAALTYAVSLLPGESKTVRINTQKKDLPHGRYTLVVGGFHQTQQRFTITL